jgi:hypothetical protein
MMRFLAEFGLVKSDDAAASVARHVEHLGHYLDRVIAEGADAPELIIRVVARSPESAPLAALSELGPKVRIARARARIVLARLDPAPALQRLTTALGEACREQDAQPALRWAKNPRLLDAHEQMTFGQAWCWSGDMMKRDAGRKNALDLFEEDVHSARLGRAAFDALWMASAAVPEARLRGVPDRLMSQLESVVEGARDSIGAGRADGLRPLTWH